MRATNHGKGTKEKKVSIIKKAHVVTWEVIKMFLWVLKRIHMHNHLAFYYKFSTASQIEVFFCELL